MPAQRRQRVPQSPYARTPKRHVKPQTPGSIFSRVRRMFTPSTWRTNSMTETDYSVQEEGVEELQPQEQETPAFKLAPLTSHDSPNVTLARFFQQKGDDPLSQVEIEGVKALLSRTTPSRASTEESHTDILQTDEDDTHNDLFNNDSFLTGSIKSNTPSFKPRYNNASTEYIDASKTLKRRKVFDFGNVRSPYRSSRLRMAFKQESAPESEQLAPMPSQEQEQEQNKTLSDSAKTLLEFLDPPSNQAAVKTKYQDFSNPYATTCRKRKSAPSPRPKQSVIDDLEKSLDEDDQQQHLASPIPKIKQQATLPSSSPSPSPSPQLQQPLAFGLAGVDKYRPRQASSLREEVKVDDSLESVNSTSEKIVEDKSEAIETEKEQEKERREPTLSFGKKTDTSSLNFGKTDESFAFSFGKANDSAVKETPALTINYDKPQKGALQSVVERSETSIARPAFSFGSHSDTTRATTTEKSLTVIPQPDTPLFVFPDASPSGFSLKDIDEAKVSQYTSLFSF